MKTLLFILPILLLLSCGKDDIEDVPEVLLKITLPEEMNGYNGVTNPIVFNDFLILAAGNSYENMATFFKLNKNGEYVDKWDVNTDHALQYYETYIYLNNLIYNSVFFDVEDKKIVSINLDDMTTNWEINSISSRSGLFGLKDKIYITQYVTSGLKFHEVDLNTQETSLVYQVSPVEYGAFVEAQVPYYYEIDNNNIGIIVTSSDSTGYILNNFNITTQQMIWSISLTEFNSYTEHDHTQLYASAPKEVQLYNEFIIINSNSHISVRKKLDGSSLWHRDRNINKNQEIPVVGQGVITDSTKKLYCYNIEDGGLRWTREYKQDGIRTGFNDDCIIYKNFLFDEVPISILNGKAKWVRIDNWGELYIEFTGKPGIDKSNDNLYYVNNYRRKLYKVTFPR